MIMLNTWSFDVMLSRIRNCMFNVGGFQYSTSVGITFRVNICDFIMEYTH